MAIAHRFGVGPEVDAYLFLVNIISWPVGVWLSVLTAVLVPLTLRMQQTAPEELSRFRSELLGLAILSSLVLGLLTWHVLPLLVRSSWVGLSGSAIANAEDMVGAMAWLLPCGVLVGLFSAMTLAGGRQIGTLLEGITPAVIVIVLLIFDGHGVQPLVYGTVVGFALHGLALAFPLASRRELVRPRIALGSPSWPAFWSGFSILLAGQALLSFTTVIDQFFAAHLGAGAIATLGFANRMLALLVGLGAVAVNRATLPIFSNDESKGTGHARGLAAHWAQILFVLGFIVMCIGWWFAPFCVDILFQRGAFTAEDTTKVAEALRYGLFQVPFFFSALVLTSFLSSRRLYIWLFWSCAIGLSVKVAGNTLLGPTLGINGIALATSLMYVVNFFFFVVVFKGLR